MPSEAFVQARNKEEGGRGGREGLRRFSRRVKVKECNKYPDLVKSVTFGVKSAL